MNEELKTEQSGNLLLTTVAGNKLPWRLLLPEVDLSSLPERSKHFVIAKPQTVMMPYHASTWPIWLLLSLLSGLKLL